MIFKEITYLKEMKDGDKEIGERKGNLIVITPVEKEDKKTIQGKITTESWREIF